MNDKYIISDELFSASLDGNTPAEDTMRVLDATAHDKD